MTSIEKHNPQWKKKSVKSSKTNPILVIRYGGLSQSEDKRKPCRICSSVDRNSDVSVPREFYHNIVLWPQCGTAPGASHWPSVFAEWAWLPRGPLTSSSTPIRSHLCPGSAAKPWSAVGARGQSTSLTVDKLNTLSWDWAPALLEYILSVRLNRGLTVQFWQKYWKTYLIPGYLFVINRKRVLIII